MSLFDKAPHPDDERYPKWLVQRMPLLTLFAAVAVWAVSHLFGISIGLACLLIPAGAMMGIGPAMARMRQTSPEAKEAARLTPATAGWGRMDAFIARCVWSYPTPTVILWMLLGGSLALFFGLGSVLGLAYIAHTHDMPGTPGGLAAALGLAVFFALGTAAIARGLLLRRRARRHSPPDTGPLHHREASVATPLRHGQSG